MSESVPFVSTPTHPPAEGSLMHWAQSRLNSAYDPTSITNTKEVGGTGDDAFERTFSKNVRAMLNMRPASREQLRVRMRKQRGGATRVIQQWYGSLEVVDSGCAETRTTGLFTGFRHITRVYEEREGYTPVVHQLWSTVQVKYASRSHNDYVKRAHGTCRVVDGPREGRSTPVAEDSRRIVEYWETEIDTQEMAEQSRSAEKDEGNRSKT
ncbi:hypothetical protein PENSPDRAFT_735161 [Peniophora sp. CONT]|nr:hypothetical protein PENSPDRAFT_735161 [Peniophora sp. CONT]